MNETPTLDDFEQAIAHTLHTKANQLVVEDEASFDPDTRATTITLVRSEPTTTTPTPSPAWGRVGGLTRPHAGPLGGATR